MVANFGNDAVSDCCTVLVLDAKNIFNLANWNQNNGVLADTGLSGYLANLVENYLSVTLFYWTDEGPREYAVTAGVLQGLVMSPFLWNVINNGVFVLPVPGETAIRG